MGVGFGFKEEIDGALSGQVTVGVGECARKLRSADGFGGEGAAVPDW